MQERIRMRTIIVTEADLNERMAGCLSMCPSLVSNDAGKEPLKNFIMTVFLLQRRNAIWMVLDTDNVEISPQMNGEMEFTGTRESLYRLFRFLEQMEWGSFSKNGNSAPSSSE